ncbi:MAG: hypothetical protein WBF93_01380 [Pirellulales bacterium]
MRELRLPKTKLILRDGTLLKLGKNDATVGSYSIRDIVDVRIEKTTDWVFPAVLIGTCLALALVSKVYIPYPGWGWVIAVILLGLAGFCSLMVSGRKVIVETTNGSAGYPVSDTFEEADGFVLSLKGILANSNNQESATPAADMAQ